MRGRPGDVAIRLRIILRALRWRGASAIMLFLVATVAVAGAAIGPMFVQAADDSVVATAIESAPAGSASVSMIVSGGPQASSELAGAVEQARRVVRSDAFGAPIFGADLGSLFQLHGKVTSEFSADLISRTAICDHVRIARGRCPVRQGQVMISERSAAVSGLHLGSRLAVYPPQGQKALRTTIVGLYVQPPTVNDAYWDGNDLFSYGTSTGPVIVLDAFIASPSTILAGATSATPAQFQALLPWRLSALVVGSRPIEHELSAIDNTVATSTSVSVSTAIPSIIASAQHDENVMGSVVLAIVLQIVLLSLLVIYALGRSAAMQRRAETEFARRRGFPRSAMLSLAVGEPAALITAAFPTGVLLAWGVLDLVGKTLFVSGVPRSITAYALIGAACGFAAALFATTAASYALWRRPKAGAQGSTRSATLVLDSVGIALALSGLLALATGGALSGGHTDPIAAVAPGLLALGAAIIGLRLAAALTASLVRKTSESRNVAWFLAVRQLARRPELLRRVLPLTAAVGVVLFAVASYTVEANNRSRVAAFETGANEVADVSLPPGLDLVDAVHLADPSRHQAMAAALYSSSSESLLAVDASRLSAVASWPSGLSKQSEAEIARLLTPKVHPAITFHGDRLRVTVSLPVRTPQIILTAALFDTVYDTPESVVFGPIRDGTHTYTTSLQGACAQSCRLDSLSPEWWNSNAFDARLVHIDVRAMAADPANTWRPIQFGAGERESWHAQTSGVGISTTTRSQQGLFISIPGDQLLSGGVIVAPSDVPQAIPAVVTSDLVHSNPPNKPDAAITASGLDGNPIAASAVSVVPALPEVGRAALLVDLPLAERTQTGPAVSETDQVWLAPSASPLILERLRHLGVAIGPIFLAASRLNALNHHGLALAYDLALIVTPIAALLALGVVIFAIGSEAGTKRREIAALSAAGVERRSLGRAIWLENGIVLVVAIVVGSAIGFGADAIAIPSLPLFTNGSGGLPVTTGLPLGAMSLTVAALIVALGASVAASSFLVFRSSFAERRRDDR